MRPDEFMAVRQTIRNVCAGFDEKGRTFESLCEELIRGLGFEQVQQQNSGIQYGRDFSAFRDTGRGRERWFFECKNLAENINVTHAAAKLIHHLERKDLHAFVLVGPSQLTNELRELLERNPFTFPVFDWTADNFVKAVLTVVAVRAKWFPTINIATEPQLLASYRRDVLDACWLPAAEPLEVRIEPRNDPPYQMAYFQRGNELFEYPTDFEFEHQVVIHNRGRSALLVRNLSVTTTSYQPLPDRLLVQMKMKGEFNPLYMSYSPASDPGAAVELLAPRVRQLQPGETELHFMKLVGCRSGIYHLQVVATFLYEGRQIRTAAIDLSLCACSELARSDSPDYLKLYTWRGHYASVARATLSQPREAWEMVARSASDDRMLYIGPVPYAELDRGTDRSVRARVTIVPIVPDPDGMSATMEVNEARELCDWGEAIGDVAPHDPMETYRSIAEFHGMTVEEFMTRFGTPKARVRDASDDADEDGERS